MKCSTCGTDNPANAKFCGNCRNPLGVESTTGNIGVETAASPAIGFPDAIKLGFQRYADFNGRSSLPEFWWWCLFSTLVIIVAAILDAAAGTYPTIYSLSFLALIVPNIAQGVRRLHDINRSGWWMLLHFGFGVGSIVLLAWACMPSKDDPN